MCQILILIGPRDRGTKKRDEENVYTWCFVQRSIGQTACNLRSKSFKMSQLRPLPSLPSHNVPTRLRPLCQKYYIIQAKSELGVDKRKETGTWEDAPARLWWLSEKLYGFIESNSRKSAHLHFERGNINSCYYEGNCIVVLAESCHTLFLCVSWHVHLPIKSTTQSWHLPPFGPQGFSPSEWFPNSIVLKKN